MSGRIHEARRRPRQARSQVTVEAILDAAEQVLTKHGYEGANTNRIAEKAGVSVGSLYQYFSDKDAILVELYERHCVEMANLFEAKVVEMATAPLPGAVRQLVEIAVRAHALNPKLHAVLMEEVPKRHLGRSEDKLKARLAQLIRRGLELRRADLRPLDLEVAVFVLVHIVEVLAHTAVLRPSPALPLERAIEEISETVLRYLGWPISQGP